MNKMIEKYEKELRRFRALLILTNGLSVYERAKIDRHINSVHDKKEKTIKLNLEKIKEKNKKIEDFYVWRGEELVLEEIDNIVENKPKPKQDTYIYPRKFVIEQLFSKYYKAQKNITKFPAHARINLDIFNIREVGEESGWLLLEASLFDDLCVHWNDTYDISNNNDPLNDMDPITQKRYRAYLNSSIKAAFNLLEAYLNGLATDILLCNQPSKKERTVLKEWDDENSKKCWLSLRDKMLQYPKIALGMDNPPLQESNCKSMKEILVAEKNYRHVLIHPNPQIDHLDLFDSREIRFYKIDYDHGYEIIDNIIEYIFTVSNLLTDIFPSVDEWLSRRNESGKFDDSLFE